MPYIKKELRKEIDTEINILVYRLKNLIEDNSSIRAGTLNYTITKLIDGLYGPLEKAGYKDYNEAIGMLECCKLEFYRKAAAPYEDLKLRENKVDDAEKNLKCLGLKLKNFELELI